jgi:LDH2 family malate/lactate/ureidoglycolate dehydrogenase
VNSKPALRYSADHLRVFAEALLLAAGVRSDIASDVAEILLEGDLMGHDTHGLALLSPYLGEITRGQMTLSGEPTRLSGRAATELWDGRRLPGPWLVRRGLDRAIEMALGCGSGSVVIRSSHHIACLAAFLPRVTERGLAVLLMCSDPGTASVAPHGGTRAVFTPDPLAVGIPTETTPILIDISASLATNAMSNRLARQGKRFEFPWLLDGGGNPTDDPSVFDANPPGTILPLGGLEAGHKGTGLAILVEMLTGGLAGVHRADAVQGWGATVFIYCVDPDAFGGRSAFARQMEWIAQASRSNPPRPGFSEVRVPGDRAWSLRTSQREEGVRLQAAILPALEPWAERFGIAVPQPI